MAVSIEKTPVGIDDGSFPRDLTWSRPAADGADKGAGVSEEKSFHDVTGDQYPHGLKLVILAGSSLVAVFLIALDQVSRSPTTMI